MLPITTRILYNVDGRIIWQKSVPIWRLTTATVTPPQSILIFIGCCVVHSPTLSMSVGKHWSGAALISLATSYGFARCRYTMYRNENC